jgi:putative spermidine/putrescine transport system substrate-binding protein
MPLSKTVNWDGGAAFDFGVPVDYMESVWSQAQFQFIYLPSRVPTASLPRSFEAWLALASARPGRLTYVFPDRGDFLAVRFLAQALTELAPAHYWDGPFNAGRYAQVAPQLWQKLRDVAPLLWRNGTRYPDAFVDQDFLFMTDQVDFATTNDVAGAQTNIDDKKYPQGSKVTA